MLPCFNEEEHVLLEIERICTAMDKSGLSYELPAIDDGSTTRRWPGCAAQPRAPGEIGHASSVFARPLPPTPHAWQDFV